MPAFNWLRSRISLRTDPNLRRLQHRLPRLPPGARIVLFGAGKHTHRRLQDLRRAALSAGARIVAACDDHPQACEPLNDLPIISSQQLRDSPCDVLLVSSDTYEAAMSRRAQVIAPAGAAVWCIYDVALEAGEANASAGGPSASTLEMKDAISSSASEPLAGRR